MTGLSKARVISTTAMTLLVAAALTPVAAQSGGLVIQVLDAEVGSSLAGARVTLSNSIHLVAESSLLTDLNGLAEFPILQSGRGYVVLVEMRGYSSVREADLKVKIGSPQTVTIRIGKEVVETVRVEAVRDVVDLDEVTHSTTFDDDFIRNLPVQGRLYTNILSLAPGVLDSDEDGNPNVHGARERDFKAVVGGVSNVDPLTGLLLTNVNIDAIDEIRVITSGAGVEYGRAQGGFADIVEKQGSNGFEGLFSFTLRSSKLDGNGASNLSSDRIPEFGLIQPALMLSGPIVKDRLWYFLANEYLDRDDPVNALNFVAVQTTERTTSSNRITWQVSRRNKLAFSFRHDPLRIENLEISNIWPPQASRTFKFGGPTYRINWSAPYSPKVLVESVVAYQDTELEIFPSTAGVPNNCVIGVESLRLSHCHNTDTGRRSGSHFLTHQDNRQRLTVGAKASIYGGRFLGMAHRLKLGFSVENERYSRFLDRQPDMTFFVVKGLGDPIGFASGRFAIPPSSRARAVGTNWSFFVEDQIRPLSNLTLTLGARLDREEIGATGLLEFDPQKQAAAVADEVIPLLEQGASPFILSLAIAKASRDNFTAYGNVLEFLQSLTSQLGIPSSGSTHFQRSLSWFFSRQVQDVRISNTNVSPFLGLSWDPFKKGKTKFAATARRFYDKIFLAVPLIEQEPVTTDVTFIASKNRAQQEWVVFRPASFSPTVNANMVDRDLRTPYQDELTLSFEQEIATETAIKLTYIRRKFRDQLQDVDVNHLPGDFGRCGVNRLTGDSILLSSPGEGQIVVDPLTGESYQDTDPSIGDGRMDDCVGDGGLLQGGQVRPDGIPDLYVQNPGWGQILKIGNFNTAEYESVVFELIRRQFRNWQMNASYAWSKAIGDAEDFNVIQGTDRTLLEDERGFLDYDQRHVAKVNAVTIVPWAGGFRFGVSAQWQSGLPYSVVNWELGQTNLPPYLTSAITEERVRQIYVTGQRNDRRNEGYWNFDVHLSKEVNLGEVNLQLTADIFNLLNDDTLKILNQTGGLNEAVRPFGRQFQVGLRLAF